MTFLLLVLLPLAYILFAFLFSFIPTLTASTDLVGQAQIGIDNLVNLIGIGIFPFQYIFNPFILSLCISAFLLIYGWEYLYNLFWFILAKIPLISNYFHKWGK